MPDTEKEPKDAIDEEPENTEEFLAGFEEQPEEEEEPVTLPKLMSHLRDWQISLAVVAVLALLAFWMFPRPRKGPVELKSARELYEQGLDFYRKGRETKDIGFRVDALNYARQSFEDLEREYAGDEYYEKSHKIAGDAYSELADHIERYPDRIREDLEDRAAEFRRAALRRYALAGKQPSVTQDKKRSFEVSRGLAANWQKQGQYRKAIGEWRRILKRVRDADIVREMHQRGERVELVDVVAEISPEDRNHIYFALGECHFALKKYAEARRYYEEYVRREQEHPDVLTAWLKIGKIYMEAGKEAKRGKDTRRAGEMFTRARDDYFGKVIATSRESGKVEPRLLREAHLLSGQANYELGSERADDENLARALHHLRIAARTAEFLPAASLLSAAVHAKMRPAGGKIAEVLKELQKIEQDYPRHGVAPAAGMMRSDVHLYENKWADAAKVLMRLVGPKNPYTLDRIKSSEWVGTDDIVTRLEKIAKHYSHVGDQLGAIKIYRHLMQYYPENKARKNIYYLKIGDSFEQLADRIKGYDDAAKRERLAHLEAAAKNYTKVIDRTSKSDEQVLANWRAGMTYYKAGDYVGAAKLFARFGEKFSDKKRASEALYRLGLSYRKVGLYKEALRAFQRNRSAHKSAYGYLSHFELGNTLLAKGDLLSGEHGGAIAVFKEIRGDPRYTPNALVWIKAAFKLGEAYFKAARGAGRENPKQYADYLQKAAATLREALERYPLERYPRKRTPEIYDFLKDEVFFTQHTLAEVLLAQDDYAGARTYYAKVRAFPVSAESAPDVRAWAKKLKHQSAYGIGLAHFREALADEKMGTEHKLNESKQHFREAFRAYRAAIEEDSRSPEVPWLRTQMALCSAALGEAEAALESHDDVKWDIEKLGAKKGGVKGILGVDYWREQNDWFAGNLRWLKDMGRKGP